MVAWSGLFVRFSRVVSCFGSVFPQVHNFLVSPRNSEGWHANYLLSSHLMEPWVGR